MDLKVQTGGLENTGRAGGAHSVDPIKPHDAAGRHPTSDGRDSVEISDLSSQIAQTLSAEATRGANRVARIAQLYARGEYRVDSSQLSRSLVDRATLGAAEAPARDSE